MILCLPSCAAWHNRVENHKHQKFQQFQQEFEIKLVLEGLNKFSTTALISHMVFMSHEGRRPQGTSNISFPNAY